MKPHKFGLPNLVSLYRGDIAKGTLHVLHSYLHGKTELGIIEPWEATLTQPAKVWNKLTEDLRSLTSLTEFKTKICQISFEHQCNCYLCK